MTKSASDDGAPADRHDRIRVVGARVNNLKDISVELPKRRLTAFTGVSGSGHDSWTPVRRWWSSSTIKR